MKLSEVLSPVECSELQNMMLHEPVLPGHTISHAAAASLAVRGLIQREVGNGHRRWVVNWEAVRAGATQAVLNPFANKIVGIPNADGLSSAQ